MAKREPIPDGIDEREGEVDLFQVTLDALEAAFLLRQPSAMEKAALLLRKIDDELDAWVRRTTIKGGCGKRERVEAIIAELEGRRKRIAALIEEYRHRNLNRKTTGPTAEFRARPGRMDPIELLRQQGHLEEWQVETARTIAGVFEALTKMLSIRARALASAGRAPGFAWRGDDVSAWAAGQYHDLYRPWWAEMARWHLCRELVVDVVVMGVAIKTARLRHRLSRKRAIDMVRRALTLWGRLDDERQAKRSKGRKKAHRHQGRDQRARHEGGAR